MPRKNVKEFTTIAIRKETKERLKRFGTKGKLYDDILNDLMDACEKTRGEILLKSTRRREE